MFPSGARAEYPRISSSHGSVTHWLARLKAGDHAAAQELWEPYFRRLVGLASQVLPRQVRQGADEEDATLSAFASFCRCTQLGRFPQLLDRQDVCQLLVVLTARKSHRQAAYAKAQKRGGGRVADTLPPAKDSFFDQLLSREPTPEFATQVAEEYQRLLDALPNDQLRRVVVWKMEGYTNEEIAAELGRTPRSVERLKKPPAAGAGK